MHHWEKFQKKKKKKELVSIAGFVTIPSLLISRSTAIISPKRKRGVPRKTFGTTFDHLERKSTITDGVMQISNNLFAFLFSLFRSIAAAISNRAAMNLHFSYFSHTTDQNSSGSFVHVIRGPDINATRFDSWHASPSFILYVNRTWIKVLRNRTSWSIPRHAW